MKTIENILFDLGGVLLRLDMGKTRSEFAKLGWKEDDWKGITHDGYLIFENLEIGLDSPAQFRKTLKQLLPGNPSDQEIDFAWSAMLLGFPSGIVAYLSKLKEKYKLYVLSNTNEIHLLRFTELFEQSTGKTFSHFFEKCYFSHEIGFRKPNPDSFRMVLEDAGITPETTLFVDDLKANTDAAAKLGMKVLHIEAGTLLETLPDYLGRLNPSS